jgi:penicillin-insensitive murein endopeptidase
VNGVKLPLNGANFGAYSSAGWAAGRTFLHDAVVAIVLEAYQALQKTLPRHSFVYGETGWKSGGSFKPHRTHQNGLSVDFMVPVLDERGESVPLPTGLFNKFGYGLEFDAQGELDDLSIDFEAVAAHLDALNLAARRRGVGIAKVIFDPALRQRLTNTTRWKRISGLPFTRRRVWVRHDEHYHVDFALPCAPLN